MGYVENMIFESQKEMIWILDLFLISQEAEMIYNVFSLSSFMYKMGIIILTY